MARRSKNMAARSDAEAELPHFEDVFERENWEARMVKARKARKNVMTHLDDIESGDSKSQAKKKTVANDIDEPSVSLKKVMETRNLKERLELAQKRHAQVQSKNRTGSSTSGFAYTRNSTDEFKKVVLNAIPPDPKSDPTSAKSKQSDGPAVRKSLPPLAQDAGVQQDDEPKKRAFLWPGLLASGIAAVFVAAVMIGGSSEQPSIVDNPSVAIPVVVSPSPAVGPEISLQQVALTNPTETANSLPNVVVSAVAKSTSPEKITYLGGVEAAPLAAEPPPAKSGAVEVSWNIGSGFTPEPAPYQIASVVTVASYVQPSVPRLSGVGLAAPTSRPLSLTLPLEYSFVSLSVIAPEIIGPVLADDFGLSGFSVAPGIDGLPNTLATGELFALLDPSSIPQTDSAPTIDTVAPVALAAPKELIAAGLPPHNIRVFAPTDLSEDVSGDVVARLKQEGFDVGSLKTVGFRISSNNVRYYHNADAEVAIALADMISAKARDFTDFSPRPPLGTVELWMKGASLTATATPTRPRAAKTRNSSNDPALQALRDRLAQRLRSGDHLGGG